MDEIPVAFLQLFDRILLNLEEEQRLLQEIILEGDDDVENQIDGADVYEELEQAINQFVVQWFEAEMLEMLHEEEEFFDLLNAPGEREIDWRAELPRMEYFRAMEDPYFLEHFRMDRHTFEMLILSFGNHLIERNRLQRLRTPVDECLFMGIWILANLDTFRGTGVHFGHSRGTIHFHYLIVIEALREIAPKYIKWPSPLERERIRRRIEERTGYPGIVGMMDGTLINITAPSIQKQRYIDWHQAYSINVLATCDDELLFRDVYIGNPGSVHDIRVFQRSSLHDLLLEKEDIVAQGEHIIGDGGFELTNKVIIPYRDLGRLEPRQTNFNYIHSSIRMAIERAFGRLKGKWRRLLKFYSKRFQYTIDHIMACFVLHNFILLNGREADGICIVQEQQERQEMSFEGSEFEDIIRDDEQRNVQNHPLLNEAKRLGILKREALADIVLHHRVNQ